MPATKQHVQLLPLSMSEQILTIVQQALNEDIGSGDVSASLLPDENINARIIAREPAIICGIPYAQQTFLLVDESIQIDWQVDDGESVTDNQVLCTLSGLASSIVSAERVALNFLQISLSDFPPKIKILYPFDESMFPSFAKYSIGHRFV